MVLAEPTILKIASAPEQIVLFEILVINGYGGVTTSIVAGKFNGASQPGLSNV